MRLLRVVELFQGLAHAQAQCQRRFAFQRQVGQHVLHQWLLVQDPATDLAVRAVMSRLGQRLAHQGTGADHAVETGHRHHLDDGRHAASLLANHPRQGPAELDFAGGIGAVAELVLQALDVELVAVVIRAMTGQQEAAEALVGLRQGEERIAHRRRTEPLVPDQLIRLPWPWRADRVGAGGVGAHVGATLFLGHGHADCHPDFVSVPDIARVVLAGEDLGQPVFGQLRLQPQRRNRGKGHGQRATGTGFGLAVQVGHRRPCHVGAGTRFGPGQRGQAMLDGGAHQLVISGVKLHQIDAMTVAIMAAEFRLVRVGQKARRHQRPAGQGTVGIDPRLGPAGAETPRPLLQRYIEAVQVGPVERGRLIGDFVGFSVLVQVHRELLDPGMPERPSEALPVSQSK
ncbi:hypothetical protein D3C79_581850 [compost metagenome]